VKVTRLERRHLPKLAEMLSPLSSTFRAFGQPPTPYNISRQLLFDDEAWVFETEAGEIAAFGMLRGFDRTPCLGVAVATEFQGFGLGKRMVNHLHARAKERGAVKVMLHVDSDNAAAVALYKGFGYVECGLHWEVLI
jgi:ribosomal protein S18 acetylase RimI-like enzyme